MPAFTYKAKDRKGGLITGTMDADSRQAAGARLQAMGYFPLDIRGGGGAAAMESSASAATRSSGSKIKAALTQPRSTKIKSLDLSEFYRQMSDLIGAGVPLVKALGIVKGQ